MAAERLDAERENPNVDALGALLLQGKHQVTFSTG